jgi:hypothetical protein
MSTRLVQQRIRVEGFAESTVNLKIAVLQLRTGQVHLAIEGVEPTIENLVTIRQLLDQVVKRIDDQLPQLVQAGVQELVR